MVVLLFSYIKRMIFWYPILLSLNKSIFFMLLKKPKIPFRNICVQNKTKKSNMNHHALLRRFTFRDYWLFLSKWISWINLGPSGFSILEKTYVTIHIGEMGLNKNINTSEQARQTESKDFLYVNTCINILEKKIVRITHLFAKAHP